MRCNGMSERTSIATTGSITDENVEGQQQHELENITV